ncbi:glucosamine-6-phosphate deaminase [Limisphaera sp. VF-2]|uniref:glucosamine-6-phosphate deaminase n=1 Tax=Limisphaera sp. VF-2 TaxID=3400418 RepID=UPI0030ACA9AF
MINSDEHEMRAVPPVRRFQVDELEVRVYAARAQLAAAAAAEAAEWLRTAIHQRGQARVILASAASQMQFLEALTAAPDLEWGRVTVFHMDEYLGLPADHPASFRRFLRERVASRVRPRAVHWIEGDALEPLKEVGRYAALLQEGPIDLCCLGIGENGHIAFNDPPVADFQDPHWIKLVALDEACRRQQVGEGWFPDLDAVPRYAYTLTVPALIRADRMIAVVPEQRKAKAVRDALCGPVSERCPASILRRHPRATLFLDLESASLLP